jgi:hypothetical protein
MARTRRSWVPKTRTAAPGSLVAEGVRIRRHFPSFNVEVRGDRLLCVGSVSPTASGSRYRVRIEYRRGDVPSVRILRPHIEPSPKIHMYRDGTLCLYDWREQPWDTACSLHATLMPWIAEWLLLYEAFELTGRWLGPEAEHGDTKVPQRGGARRRASR